VGDVRQVAGIGHHFDLRLGEIRVEDIAAFIGNSTITFSLNQEDGGIDFGKEICQVIIANELAAPGEIADGDGSGNIRKVVPAGRIRGWKPRAVGSLVHQLCQWKRTEMNREEPTESYKESLGRRESTVGKSSGDCGLDNAIWKSRHEVPTHQTPQRGGEEIELSISQMICKCHGSI